MLLALQASASRAALAALCVSLLGLAPLHAGRAGDETFTPAHVAKLRGVSSAVISPDGAHIAYLLSVPRRPFEDDDGPAWSELHVVDQRGASRPFVTGSVSVSNLEWTPGGAAISFTSKRSGDEHAALYVIPLDGGEARRVLSHPTGVGAYTWSPDGTQVAFTAADKKPAALEADEKQGFDAEVYEERLQFARVLIARPRLAPGAAPDDAPEPRVLELEGHASTPRWSPDGAHLAVGLAPTPLVDDDYMKKRIHVVDVATGRSLASFDTPGKLGDYRWSPDGEHLAIIAGEDVHDPLAGRLFVGARAGGATRNLTKGFEGDVHSIAWKNATTLLCVTDEGVTSSLRRIELDGSAERTILAHGAHALGELTLSADGLSGAFVGDASTHPGEVLAMRHGEAAPRRLTSSNPWLEGMRFAEQEAVRFRARDDLELDGLLIHPLEREPGARVPLIVVVHGGPEAHYRNGWLTAYSMPGQVGAARGFAVFYPNYRGSTGRGVEFSKRGQGDYAGAEFDDLVDGVEHLVARGLVDRAKVGVTGGSYGGFAAAWCATALTEHFAAAVMFVGISEHISKFGTTDIPNEMNLVHERRWPWEDWEHFYERSPVRHVEQARTPILILHGKDDTRVHPSQSMVLYRYLKTLGQVPVRLVLYPGEGHGNRKAAARLDYNLRLIQWMEHYLVGPGGAPPPYELDLAPYRPKKDEKEPAAG